jgi:sugar phosphate isomerase/epimerase
MRPFRLGSTSYVFGEELVPNVRQLAEWVDDIELVLWEVAGYGSNLPSAAAIAELNELAHEYDLTYTVHLPVDLKFGDAIAYDKIRRAVDATRDLSPYAFVMHLDGRIFLSDTSPATVARWQKEAAEALTHIVEWIGNPSQLALENVERWDPDYFRELVLKSRVSRCVDIGHLWLEGCDPLSHLSEHLPRTRVIHLHGVSARDHQSLSYVPEVQLLSIVEFLLRSRYDGVVTLEVFGAADFLTSRETLLRALERAA